MKRSECQWPECWQFCGEPCEPDYEPLGFPDRPVYPVKPAKFDDASLLDRVVGGWAFIRWVARGFK